MTTLNGYGMTPVTNLRLTDRCVNHFEIASRHVSADREGDVNEPTRIGVIGPDMGVAGLAAVLERQVGAELAVDPLPFDDDHPGAGRALVLYAAPHLMDEEHRLRRLVQVAAPVPVGLLGEDLPPSRVARARDAGVTSVISSLLPAARLTDAVRRALAAVGASSGARSAPVTSLPSPDEVDGVPAGHPGLEAHGLSRREAQVLVLAAEGLTNREIAAALYLSPETVKGYLRDVFAKLGLRNRVAAAAYVHAQDDGARGAGAPRPSTRAPR